MSAIDDAERELQASTHSDLTYGDSWEAAKVAKTLLLCSLSENSVFKTLWCNVRIPIPRRSFQRVSRRSCSALAPKMVNASLIWAVELAKFLHLDLCVALCMMTFSFFFFAQAAVWMLHMLLCLLKHFLSGSGRSPWSKLDWNWTGSFALEDFLPCPTKHGFPRYQAVESKVFVKCLPSTCFPYIHLKVVDLSWILGRLPTEPKLVADLCENLTPLQLKPKLAIIWMIIPRAGWSCWWPLWSHLEAVAKIYPQQFCKCRLQGCQHSLHEFCDLSRRVARRSCPDCWVFKSLGKNCYSQNAIGSFQSDR